ncbi:MAG: acyl-CoA dehydrogenase family protein [Acidimicrobiales bacterium]
MDLTLPGDDHPCRLQVRDFLSSHPEPTGRELAEAGYVAPHWPEPWGLGAGPVDQLIIDEELRRAGVRRPDNVIGIGWAGPTLIYAGTKEQKERYLLPLLSGEEIWCQLFSEPDAGSDLANLSTRAVRDGDTYIVSGQKIWTSAAHQAQFGILIVRTDPEAPRHDGITYLICPMDAPGISIRPIVEMTGAHNFNEVFLDEVRLPVRNRVGQENHGWALAKVTLGNERVSLSGEGALWGRGPTAHDLIEVVRRHGGCGDPVMRQRLAALFTEASVLRTIRLRTVSSAVAGRSPGPEASVRKALADDHGRHVMALAKDLCGAAGMLGDATPFGDPDPTWAFGYLFSPALTIGGGTAEVQRNIIAERVLGLPRELDRQAGETWSKARAPRSRAADI